MNEIKLPSGRTLIVRLAPFAESKALYQEVLKELVTIKADPKAEFDTNFIKDIVCGLLSSKRVEDTLKVCMQRCTIDGLKIDDDSFEDEKFRGDYLNACAEIGKANVVPFVKDLYAEYFPTLGNLLNGQK